MDIFEENCDTENNCTVSYFWKGLALFLLGVIIGLFVSPIKKGVTIGCNNKIDKGGCNDHFDPDEYYDDYDFDDDEDDFDNTANDDNSPTSKVNMTNYLAVSVNGNGIDNDENKTYPSVADIQKNIPYAVYTGNKAGGVFSPAQ